MDAFWANSGALSWSASTGAYVYSSPAVTDVPGLGPTVYIGSYDGNFYAYDADSGGVRWSHAAGGRIDGSATVLGNVVYYSDLGSNTTAGLNWRTGSKVFSFPDGEFSPGDHRRQGRLPDRLLDGLPDAPEALRAKRSSLPEHETSGSGGCYTGMRRALVTCLIAAAAAGGTSTVAAAEAPRASLEAPICQQASDPLDRVIAITAVMRPLTGTARMELQFNLLEKPRGSSSYSVVTGGDLGKWITPSDPALGQRPDDVWILRKLVVNLAAPSGVPIPCPVSLDRRPRALVGAPVPLGRALRPDLSRPPKVVGARLN